MNEDRDYGAGLRLSLAVHGLVIGLVLVKSLIFPGNPVVFIPTLRVDVVGLPDVLKKDLQNISPANKQINEVLKSIKPIPKEVPKEAPPKEAAKEPPADPKEMVLHPKAATETAAEREKRMKSALKRIEALNKIEGASEEKPQKIPTLIKGNKVSKGSSLSGEAREAAEASYFDSLRDKLQDNWALPVWIARQNYSAQVQIFIDAHGQLHGFKFVKTSGNAQFDDAVKRSIQESAPFPAPPDALASTVLGSGVLIGFPL